MKVRAESMAAAAGMGSPHGMLSVVGLNDADLEAVCKEVGPGGSFLRPNPLPLFMALLGSLTHKLRWKCCVSGSAAGP